MGRFYEKLSYSIGNEDWSTEQEALQITPECRVVAITASGDRPLNLLTQKCRELVAIDANPFQNHLLWLKCAALQTLDYVCYLEFLGVHQADNRLQLYDRIASQLPESSKQFWDVRKSMIQAGVIYQGTVEKLCRKVAFAVHMIRGPKVRQLFSCQNLDEQAALIDKTWEMALLRRALKICLHPWVSRLFIGDPGLYLTIGPKITPGEYIYNQMRAFLDKRLANESLLLSLLLNGKIDKTVFSPYLMEEGIQQILPNLHTLRTQDTRLVEFLEQAQENSIDRFSLSDVASYLRRPDYIRLIRAMHRAAKPGARFCMRQFLSSHEIPEELNAYFHREYDLEQKLQHQENCFLYRFNVGTIVK